MKTAVVTFCFVVAALAGCGGQQKAILGIEKGLHTAGEAYVAWDKTHQEQIVAEAKTEAEATERIAAYRVKRAEVMRAFVIAYDLLALAMTDPKDTSHYLDALMAAKDVFMRIKDLAEGKSP